MDLGAAPSWSQLLSKSLLKKNNYKSRVYAIDVKDIKPIERVIIIKKDINEILKEK